MLLINKIHLVRTSAFNCSDYEQCIALLNKEDAIVLLDDGCYNLHHQLTSKALSIIASENFYIIKSHRQARALEHEHVNNITMNDLVNLIIKSNGTITWQ